jgi:hypothetical protein
MSIEDRLKELKAKVNAGTGRHHRSQVEFEGPELVIYTDEPKNLPMNRI